MKPPIFTKLLSVIAFFILSYGLNAQTIIKPTFDTYSEFKSPNDNFGNKEFLRFRSNSTEKPDVERYVYLEFDVSNLEELQGEVILELHRTKERTNTNIQVQAFSDENFNENSLTWNNQPQEDALYPIYFGRETTNNSIKFDITNWANYMIVAGKPLQLKVSTNTFDKLEYIASKEHSDTSKHPVLKCYTEKTENLPIIKKQSPVKTDMVKLIKRGKLKYTLDDRKNRIIDFGMVGYHQGLKPLPKVNKNIVEITPKSGDRTADIQAVINQVSNFEQDANGHRGVVLLKKGYYEINGELFIKESGVIVRGEGNQNETNGTMIFNKTTNGKAISLTIDGQEEFTVKGDIFNVENYYVPIGTKEIKVQNNHNFQVGDAILITRIPNEAWISLLGMDKLEDECGADKHGNWTPEKYTVASQFNILDVCDNTLMLDTPIVDPIDPEYATATVQKYDWAGITECGVENIRFESSFTGEFDENHAKRAILLKQCKDCWVTDVKAKNFGNNLVKVENAYQVTVDGCEMEDYKSQIKGGRRYGFSISKSKLVIVKNSKSNNGRHDFNLNSKTQGPNVMYNCTVTNANSDSGPHARWSTGILWESVKTNNKINVQNRKCSGSGHGWAGSQHYLWNCEAGVEFIFHDPPKDHTNVAIGCTGKFTNVGMSTQPLGYIEKENEPVKFSLYVQQAMEHQERMKNHTPSCSNNGSLRLASKARLEGFMVNDKMSNELNMLNLLPNEQPFSVEPWYYEGSEYVENFDANIVDWVLISLYDSEKNIITQKAALINQNDEIVSHTGSTELDFNVENENIAYISLHHKSHLAVVAKIEGNNITVDFTEEGVVDGYNQTHNAGGKQALIVGDYDNNGLINNIDYNIWMNNGVEVNTYLQHDADGNGIINNLDFNLWDGNKSKLGNPIIQE